MVWMSSQGFMCGNLIPIVSYWEGGNNLWWCLKVEPWETASDYIKSLWQSSHHWIPLALSCKRDKKIHRPMQMLPVSCHIMSWTTLEHCQQEDHPQRWPLDLGPPEPMSQNKSLFFIKLPRLGYFIESQKVLCYMIPFTNFLNWQNYKNGEQISRLHRVIKG